MLIPAIWPRAIAKTNTTRAAVRRAPNQPAAQVLDLIGSGAAEPQPPLLDRIVGLAGRPELPAGHRQQVIRTATGSMTSYWHVDDIRKSLKPLLDIIGLIQSA